MGPKQTAETVLPPHLYFHARDYEAHTPKVENGQSVAQVHAHRRSQALADVFARLDRLRGAVKQLRYMDETGHIGHVVPHVRQRAAVVFADLDSLLADIDAAIDRHSGPDDDPAAAQAEGWHPVQDPPPADSPSNVRIFDAQPPHPDLRISQTIPERTVPSPRDVVAETNDAALARRRELERQSRLRWSSGGGSR